MLDGASQTAAGGKAISFSENDQLLWPVEGVLLMNYSMDKTIYFSTLDQFKYNPALVIEGKVVSAGKVLKAKEVEKFLH